MIFVTRNEDENILYDIFFSVHSYIISVKFCILLYEVGREILHMKRFPTAALGNSTVYMTLIENFPYRKYIFAFMKRQGVML
jgi:hypothetical protein